MNAPLWGGTGGPHRHRPYQSPSYFSTQSHTNKMTIYAQSTQTKPTVHAQFPQKAPTAHTQSTKRNRRGGACVPARTSAQRRFHTKNTRIVAGNERWMRPCGATRAGSGVSIPKKVCVSRIIRGEFNDRCAPAGRHGRAHRRRPYPSPPNHVVCHYPIGVILSIAQGW